jgi:phenylalanyl-tRNA synthetase alpha chain
VGSRGRPACPRSATPRRTTGPGGELPDSGQGGHIIQLLVDAAVALTPGRPYRSEPRLHPYTVDGRQVDVCWDGGVGGEVWECGLAHPAVLEAAGLAGWRPVSAMPPVHRDLSVAVQADDTVEDLDQDVLLVRVVLRHLERTLTDEEANRIRDRIYAALHRGGAQRWAARPG